MTDGDHPKILKLASSLTDWFTPSGLEKMRSDLEIHDGLIATEKSEVIGFLIFQKTTAAVTISWMGVDRTFQREGIGSALLAELKLEIGAAISKIFVSTLGESVDYEPYKRTRAFYRKNGFVDFERIKHPDNPEQEEELILSLDF